MTRQEEIALAALNYICSNAVSAENMQLAFGDFTNGAEWADKTMIEKAWDWFYNMALDYMSDDITDVKWGSMKEDFFKAMEE